MMYLLALLLPPIALLLSGKIFQAILNLILIILSIIIFVATLSLGSFISFPLYIISIIHAVLVVHGVRNDRKIEEAVSKAQSDQ